MPDELDRRVRSLEAERLRPVPPPPPLYGGTDALRLLEEIVSSSRRYPEPPGPRGSSESSQHDTDGGSH